MEKIETKNMLYSNSFRIAFENVSSDNDCRGSQKSFIKFIQNELSRTQMIHLHLKLNHRFQASPEVSQPVENHINRAPT